jgi:glycosyltransferase involved in cell wall biosynthesis
MKILFIAPIPPPITGHSKCSELLLNHLSLNNEIYLINLSKNNFKNGKFEFERFFQILKILYLVLKYKNSAQKIYLTISQSFGGNIKDLFIYLLLSNKLKSTVIHLHGGSINTNLFTKKPLIFKINKYFYQKLKAIILLGDYHIEQFKKYVDNKKLYGVFNFYEPEYLLNKIQIASKFKFVDNKVKLLFLSNMQVEKGYDHILDAFNLLDSSQKQKIEIHFAGKFDNLKDEIKFLNKIKNEKNLHFHGFIDGQKKKELLYHSHILCLPTSFLEGQPVSIIEAYASGLIVLAPKKGGIIDIFTEKNGFEIECNPNSISISIIKIIENKENLVNIAIHNNMYAQNNFRLDNHLINVSKIIKY